MSIHSKRGNFGGGRRHLASSSILLLAVAGCVVVEKSSLPDTDLAPSADYSGNVRRGYVDSRHGQIHIRSVRPAPERSLHTPLLALHQSPNSGQVFSSFLPLIGQDRITIAPDNPGYGMSDLIDGTQRIQDYAAAMLDVIDASIPDGPVDLLGYHTGAAVALEMARQRPKRIRRLVLVSVPVLTDEERASGAALPAIAFDEGGEFAREEWRRSWRWRGPGQSVQSVLATYSAKMRPGVRELGARAVLAYDLTAVLEAAEHPMMIVRVRDDLWEATARAMLLRPNVEYAEFPARGHGLFDAVPEEVDAVIRQFLDRAD